MSDSPVEFIDELPEGGKLGRPSRYDPLFKELRKHPGKWGRMTVAKNANTASATTTYLASKYGKDYEVEHRGLEVYARFVGK